MSQSKVSLLPIPKLNQSWQFLPHLRLPKASDSESWSSVDNWIRENITPRVLQAVDIESKYQQLTVTLFTYLKQRFGCTSPRRKRCRPCNLDQTKKQLNSEFQHQLLEKLQSRKVQGFTSRLTDTSPDMWSAVMYKLPSEQFSFALNAVSETLPTNANLLLWRKRDCDKCPLCSQRQTLLHVLNNCPVLLNKGLYTHRHDSILRILYNMARLKLPKENIIYADLECSDVPFPSHIINSRLRPDIII